MNKNMSDDQMGALLLAQAAFAANRTGFGKRRDTKKKIDRGVRKNRRVMARDSRRCNRMSV